MTAKPGNQLLARSISACWSRMTECTALAQVGTLCLRTLWAASARITAPMAAPGSSLLTTWRAEGLSWGEDGIAGICDRYQLLVFALAM